MLRKLSKSLSFPTSLMMVKEAKSDIYVGKGSPGVLLKNSKRKTPSTISKQPLEVLYPNQIGALSFKSNFQIQHHRATESEQYTNNGWRLVQFVFRNLFLLLIHVFAIRLIQCICIYVNC